MVMIKDWLLLVLALSLASASKWRWAYSADFCYEYKMDFLGNDLGRNTSAISVEDCVRQCRAK